MKLLFVSNLFPDTREPYRGLDNATVLHHLRDHWEVRAVALRPSLPFAKEFWQCREEDRVFEPQFLSVPYLPKLGGRVNHRLMSRAVRGPLRELRSRFAFDIVLCAWLFPDACAIAELARELEFPLVAIAQGSDVHQYVGMPARRRVMERLLPAAHTIITRSADLARMLAELGLEKTRIQPILNGVDTATFHPGDASAARIMLGLNPSARVILFVGNLRPIKNPLVLIEALARLCGSFGFENSELVLIGGGPLASAARALAERLGCGQKVIFAGRKDAAAVAEYMRAADVLCLPSDNEGVPNVILEAFASGLPVVASNVGGIAEVHTGEHLGRLVPPRDASALAEALQSVLSSRPSRESIANYGTRFTWAGTASAYHAVLSEAAK